jgi:succinoglycan biosynthesis protein ExoA
MRVSHSTEESHKAPAVSLIVPCRNEAGHIRTFLDSVMRQQRPSGGMELIVADGMSDDGTRQALEEFAHEHDELHVIENRARIAAAGLNAAIRVARAPVIIRLDVHTTYADDYVLQCVAVLEQSQADAIGGPWVARGRCFAERAIAAVFQSRFGCGGARGHDPHYDGEVDVVYLGCWRRKIFDRVGLFDEELARNEDDEFSFRLRRAGGILRQSTRIRSWYTPRNSLRALFRQYAQYGYWKVRVIRKHRMPASPRHLVPGAFVFSLVSLGIGAVWSPLAQCGAAALVGMYSLCNVVASVHTAAQSEWKLLPFIPMVFAAQHVGYGAGFLHGVWDLMVLRRAPRGWYAALTRASERLQYVAGEPYASAASSRVIDRSNRPASSNAPHNPGLRGAHRRGVPRQAHRLTALLHERRGSRLRVPGGQAQLGPECQPGTTTTSHGTRE